MNLLTSKYKSSKSEFSSFDLDKYSSINFIKVLNSSSNALGNSFSTRYFSFITSNTFDFSKK